MEVFDHFEKRWRLVKVKYGNEKISDPFVISNSEAMKYFCDLLAENNVCEKTWDSLEGTCGNGVTPGYIKDDCKVSCESCSKGKNIILIENLQILLLYCILILNMFV